MKWHDLFFHDKVDGLLYWKWPRGRKVKAGDPAGCLSRGYLCVMIEGRRYRAHRIIFEMTTGPIPDRMQIDHINGVRDDNRVDNLRIVTGSQNNWNTCTPKHNRSGLKGVCWHKATQKWESKIKIFGQRKHLGLFATAEEAYAARIEAEQNLHGQYAASVSRKSMEYCFN